MTSSTTHCDRCQGLILEGRALLRLETGPAADRHRLAAVDLCGDCLTAFQRFLREPERAAALGGLAAV